MRRRLATLLALPAAAVLAGALPAAPDPVECEMKRPQGAHVRSTRCLACHDGTVAETAIAAPAATHDGTGENHPVDVDYLAAWQREPTRYRDPAELPPALPLVDGKVACTTCHDPRSRIPGAPAMTMVGSAMCLACHTL
jgi:predicted CXXCH cytochrome family protein